MLVISRVPFAWVGPMLAAGGGLLVLRGMIGAFLIFRPAKEASSEGARRQIRQPYQCLGIGPGPSFPLHQRTKEEDRAQGIQSVCHAGNIVDLAVGVIIV